MIHKRYDCLVIPIFIIIVTLIMCLIFVKPKVLNFNIINEYTYFENNIELVDKIVLTNYTQLGEINYLIDNEVGISFLKNLKIEKESNEFVTHGDRELCVYFDNGKKVSFDFEYDNFVYNNKRYEVNNKISDLIVIK